MKLEVGVGSPRRQMKTMRYVPYLNGKRLERCSAADARLGWARVLATDERGVAVIDVEKGRIVEKVIRGRIRFRRVA